MLKKAKTYLVLDFSGEAQNWVCYIQFLFSSTRIGIPIVDLIHPFYKNNFIHKLYRVNTIRHFVNFNLLLKEIGYFTLVIALVEIEEYRYLMIL